MRKRIAFAVFAILGMSGAVPAAENPYCKENYYSQALLIGNKAYLETFPVPYSHNDVDAIKKFLIDKLCYREGNVQVLKDATFNQLRRWFGPTEHPRGRLWDHAKKGQSNIFVYYSGHGATNSSHSETYMLPVDAEPYREERGGYPLSTLYDNLAALKAESVLVLLESAYGRDHGGYVLPPNLPETTSSALPDKPLSTVTVLSATDRGQRALIDTGYDVGLFTRYAIEGLAGRADLYPVGNGDGVVDSAELYAYAAAMARLSARKTFGLLQEPVYSSAETPVLSGSGVADAKSN